MAGYCYPWPSKNSNDPSIYDIELEGAFRARWNFNSTDTWAIDPDSFDQVGCIHTAQGLEFDYVGVIYWPRSSVRKRACDYRPIQESQE